jgi:hypothetical protein
MFPDQNDENSAKNKKFPHTLTLLDQAMPWLSRFMVILCGNQRYHSQDSVHVELSDQRSLNPVVPSHPSTTGHPIGISAAASPAV